MTNYHTDPAIVARLEAVERCIVEQGNALNKIATAHSKRIAALEGKPQPSGTDDLRNFKMTNEADMVPSAYASAAKAMGAAPVEFATPDAAGGEAAVEAMCAVTFTPPGAADHVSALRQPNPHLAARAILAAIREGKVPGVFSAEAAESNVLAMQSIKDAEIARLTAALAAAKREAEIAKDDRDKMVNDYHEAHKLTAEFAKAQAENARLVMRDVELVRSAQNAQAMVLRTVDERDQLRKDLAAAKAALEAANKNAGDRQMELVAMTERAGRYEGQLNAANIQILELGTSLDIERERREQDSVVHMRNAQELINIEKERDAARKEAGEMREALQTISRVPEGPRAGCIPLHTVRDICRAALAKKG